MDLFYITITLIFTIGFTGGEKEADDFNCKAEIQELKNIIKELNNTLQNTGIRKRPLPLHVPEKRLTPEGAVAFYAYATKSVILGDQQTIVFDHVVTNLASGYDAQDGQFTAPLAGLYYFSTSLMAYPGHYIHAQIVHNGDFIAHVFAAKGAYGFEDDTGTAVANLVLQKGDKIWVRHQNDPSGIAQLEEYYSAFSGFLILPM